MESMVGHYSDHIIILLKITNTLERVIESLPWEAAGFGNCVHQLQRPARRCFGRRVLEWRGYRNSTAVWVPLVWVSARVRREHPLVRARGRVHARNVSLRCACVSSSRSPTTNEKTITAERNSRYVTILWHAQPYTLSSLSKC